MPPLKQRLAEVTAERDQLRAAALGALARLRRPTAIAAPAAPSTPPSPPATVASEKGYLQSTKASRARHGTRTPDTDTAPEADHKNLSSFRITIDGIPRRHHDGMLVRDNSVSPACTAPGQPSYMAPTLASQVRGWLGTTEAYQRVREWEDGRRARKLELRATEELGMVRPEEEENPEFGRARPASPQEPTPAANGNTPTHPNWIDNEFALVNCFADVLMAYEFAKLALELGKESLRYYAKERDPAFCKALSPYGPSMVAASRYELRFASGGGMIVREIGIDPELLEDFANLRNFVCHPQPCPGLVTYDTEAERAERLMAHLGDEDRLRKLWAARDALRVEALRTLTEIEEREAVAELPGGYLEDGGVWEAKHIWLLKRLLKPEFDEEWRRNPDNLYPVVRRVSKRWGEMNP